ncbi:hypothetical protein LINGRAHAP2_LOCUS9737 [Linum grandiflorum]
MCYFSISCPEYLDQKKRRVRCGWRDETMDDMETKSGDMGSPAAPRLRAISVQTINSAACGPAVAWGLPSYPTQPTQNLEFWKVRHKHEWIGRL